MHSAELNVPQNHVYLFKPQFSDTRRIRRGFGIMSANQLNKEGKPT